MPVGVPSQKIPFVACKSAYASDVRDVGQKGNGYAWEDWEVGGKRDRTQLIIIVTIFFKKKCKT